MSKMCIYIHIICVLYEDHEEPGNFLPQNLQAKLACYSYILPRASITFSGDIVHRELQILASAHHFYRMPFVIVELLASI